MFNRYLGTAITGSVVLSITFGFALASVAKVYVPMARIALFFGIYGSLAAIFGFLIKRSRIEKKGIFREIVFVMGLVSVVAFVVEFVIHFNRMFRGFVAVQAAMLASAICGVIGGFLGSRQAVRSHGAG